MIPLATPNISGNEGRYLEECVRTNYVSSVGPFVDRLEGMVAASTGARYAVATSSGTAGLHLALISAGVERDDLVMVPSFTFIASANAVAHCGATPWLIDIAPDSWTLDPAQVAEALERDTCREGGRLLHVATGRRVAAILPVYALGMPADMDGLRKLEGAYRLPLVADSAAAAGARYRSRNIGGLADLTVLSFNGNKTVTAGGGGMVIGNDPELLRHARHISTTARVGNDYDHDCIGYNYRMTNLQAAVGCAQMERLDEFVAAKRRIDARYRTELAALPGIAGFPAPAWGESACWFSGIVVDRQGHRPVAELAALLRDRGIEARTFWKPVHLQRPFAAAPRSRMDVCESLWQRILTLPCSTHLSDDDQARVIAAVKDVLR